MSSNLAFHSTASLDNLSHDNLSHDNLSYKGDSKVFFEKNISGASFLESTQDKLERCDYFLYPTPPKAPCLVKSFFCSLCVYSLLILAFAYLSINSAEYKMSAGELSQNVSSVPVELVPSINTAFEIESVEFREEPENIPEDIKSEFEVKKPEEKKPEEKQPEKKAKVAESKITKEPKKIEIKKENISNDSAVKQVTDSNLGHDNQAQNQNPINAAGTGDGSMQISKEDLKAAYLRNPAPKYPSQSRINREEGTVLLKVSVNKNGEVDSLMIKQSSGFERLDEAAKNSVHKWVFKPKTVAGISVESTIEVPIKFLLK